MTGTMTGGCQCGRVRYAVAIADDDAYLCHCGMCRHATGGVSVAFKTVAQADLTWTAVAPDAYQSSSIARRPFCSACGTPLGFQFLDEENIDLTIGSFDDPSRFRPTENLSIETALPAWMETAHLPGRRLADHAPVADRWKKAVGKLPD